MYPARRGVVLLLAALFAALWGCSEKKDQAATPAAPAVAAPVELPAEARETMTELLGSYEQIRSLLAQDKLDGIAEAAARLSEPADRALGSAPEILRDRLKKLASRSAHLKQDGSKDLQHARRAFGEVSRHVVGLISAAPSLARDRFVFQCPMTPADSYNKWVQTAKDISNPYMGTKMAGCGSPSDWRE